MIDRGHGSLAQVVLEGTCCMLKAAKMLCSMPFVDPLSVLCTCWGWLRCSKHACVTFSWAKWAAAHSCSTTSSTVTNEA